MTNPTNRGYEILEVAELTGLAPARLRAWERRYAVVRPRRLPNRYRVYSSEQVALLRAFARLCEAGERIGDLVKEPRESVLQRALGQATDGSPLALLVEAVRRLDRERFSAVLAAELQRLGPDQWGRRIVLPLAQMVGDLWALGKLTVAAEHLASEVVVHQLKRQIAGRPEGAPVILAACLPREQHEWGVLVTLMELAGRGWRVEYLGQDLPLKDLVDAAWTLTPRVVGLSGASPANVESLLPELRRLHRLLPPGAVVVLGGEGSEVNRSRLKRAGLRVGLEAVPELPPGQGTP